MAGRVSKMQKVEFLSSLGSADLRSQVAGPLLHRMGWLELRSGALSVYEVPSDLGAPDTVRVAVVAGNLNQGAGAENRLAGLAETLGTVEISVRRTVVIVGGKASDSVRTSLESDIQGHVRVLDRDDLIPLLNIHFEELWLGIDPKKYPYLAALVASLTTSGRSKGDEAHPFDCPVTGVDFMPLHVSRTKLEVKRIGGRRVSEPSLEEFEVVALARKDIRRALLLGDAGAGKTTSMRRLAVVLAEAAMEGSSFGKVPIILRAKSLLEQELSNELLDEKARRIANTSSPVLEEEDFERGEVALFLDGLDEVSAQEDRQAILDEVLGWSVRYPRCRLLLSSRDYSWLHKLRGIDALRSYRISPVSWKETQSIINRVSQGNGLPVEQAKDVLRRLQEVHGLQLNPLLVTVFVASSDYSRGDIPANITEIFKKFTEEMLGRWDAAKGFSEQYHAPLKDFLIRRIAGHMHRAGETTAQLDLLSGWLEKELALRGHKAESQQLLNEIVYRSGLFRQVDDAVEFQHHLLQEFFAGRDLAQSELSEVVADSWWSRPLVFYFGEHPDQVGLLSQLSEQVHELEDEDALQAAMTLGLTLQASYLSKVEARIDVLARVLHGLAFATHRLFSSEAAEALKDFVMHYVVGRDAVATRLLETHLGNLELVLGEFEDVPYSDYLDFWLLTGLVEIGSFDRALARVKEFKPSDERTLLALHLGANLCVHLGHHGKEQTKKASRLVSALEPRTVRLKQLFLEEFKAELVEMREGRVEPLVDDRHRRELPLADEHPLGEGSATGATRE